MLLIKPTDIDIEVWNGPFGKICNELMKRKDDMHVNLWDDSINEATYMDVVSKSLQTKKYIDDGYIGSSRLIDYNNEYTYYMMFISIIKGDNYKLNHIGSMFNPSINSVYENIILLKIDINKQIVHMNFEEIMPLIEKKRLHKCVYVDENDNKQEVTINNAWVVDGKGNENIYQKNYKRKITHGNYILLLLSNKNVNGINSKGPLYILALLDQESKMLTDFTLEEYKLLKKSGIVSKSISRDSFSNCEDTQNINRYQKLLQNQ